MKCNITGKILDVIHSNKKNENKRKEIKRLNNKKKECEIKYQQEYKFYRIINLDDKIHNTPNYQYRDRTNLRKFINTIKSNGHIKINKVTNELILEIIDYFNLKVPKDKNPILWFKQKYTRKIK